MASKQAERLSTDVYHNETEQAVRSRSQHSRSAHIPKTDDDGNIVTDDDGHPEPECGVEPTTDTEWVLRSVREVSNRDKCRRCFAADEVADQNKANGGSMSFARKLRYGDEGEPGSSGDDNTGN